MAPCSWCFGREARSAHACGHAVCRRCRKEARCGQNKCACCRFDALSPVVSVSPAPLYDAAARLLRSQFRAKRSNNTTTTPPLAAEEMRQLEAAAQQSGLLLVRNVHPARNRASLEPARREDLFIYRWGSEEALMATAYGPHAEAVAKDYAKIFRMMAPAVRRAYSHEGLSWDQVPIPHMAWARFNAVDALAAAGADEVPLLSFGAEKRLTMRPGADLVVTAEGIAYFDNERLVTHMREFFDTMGASVIFSGALLLAQASRASKGETAFFEEGVILGACAFAWALMPAAQPACPPYTKPNLEMSKGEKIARAHPRLLACMADFQALCARRGSNPAKILDYKISS